MKSLLVFNARGGFGNQLFIAAAAMDLSQELNSPTYISMLNVDKAHLRNGSDIRRVRLPKNLFSTSNPFYLSLIRITNSKKMNSAIKSILNHWVVNFEEKSDRHLNILEISTIIKKFPRNKVILVNGYFQDFCYSKNLVGKLQDIFQQQETKYYTEFGFDYCAVHIRLGDMLKYTKSMGVLSKNFYEKAISQINQVSSNPILLISDDIQAASKMLPQSSWGTVVPMQPGEDAIIGFYRIMCGQSIVTSNSTFSYWAAFLSRSASLVIVPSSTSFDKKTQIKNIPSNWLKIESEWIE